MAENKQEVAVEAVDEKSVKKTPAKTTTAKKQDVTVATESAAAQTVEEKPAKKPAKKAATKTKTPLYINGRYIVEKELPQKPQKGAKPYAAAKKSIKVTLVKSTAGCLKDQQATVAALGLTKIRSTNVLPDNDAIRGMIFKVKHLVVVEEVK